MRKHSTSLFICTIFMCLMVFLSACRKETPADSFTFIEVGSYETDSKTGESTVEIPSFVSNDEQIQKDLKYLNDETDYLVKLYEKSKDKDLGLWIKSYPSEQNQIMQVTVCWFEEHPILGNDYNLMSLAYNAKTGEPITSKEALNMTGITGVDLTTNVVRCYQTIDETGKLDETEMQGFILDDQGNVSMILMKLSVETEEGEYERHFYQYDFVNDQLTPVSELGYPLP